MRRIFSLLLLVTISLSCHSQDSQDDDDKPSFQGNHKGFNLGLELGCYFANQSTSAVYDGYGYDFDGVKNSFENSFMYNKIVLQYGGNYGQPDLIAQALGVNHGEWNFSESDMPQNMRYQPAFLVGLKGRYSVDAPNAIIFNVNAVQLNITGNFTIVTRPPSGSSQINNSIRTCAIKGVEQRLLLQVGYQHIFDPESNLNFFLEGGLNVTMAKFARNEILINDLLIDLTTYYYQPGYNAFSVKKPIGTGLGAFGGLGVNANMNNDFRIQLLYNPTYEGVKLGEHPGLHFQHSLGLRIYYGF